MALLSLSDLGGAQEFAAALAARGTRLLASGGTARHLRAAGLGVTDVADWTGVPELLGGRVKTLHPSIHAPILARRDQAGDMATLRERGLDPIDLVAVSLYPFETRAAALDEPAAIEEIDVGGVALLRAAAKNFAGVIVVHDPSQYPAVLLGLERGVTPAERRDWAAAAFARTAGYDAAIASELSRRGGEALPPVIVEAFERVRGLRYGENPHQRAALYERAGRGAGLDARREVRELSFNNLLDVEAAAGLAYRWADTPACVIVKHTQPCGAARAATLAAAWDAALETDPQSAFGGIVAFNRALDSATAARMAGVFLECVVAPGYDAGAIAVLEVRRNLRLVTLAPGDARPPGGLEVRRVGPWALAQRDAGDAAPDWRCVTRRAPQAAELGALRFAWDVVAVARSNAIAIARGTELLGLGSGQTSRVDAVDVAILKARRAGHELGGASLASDAFLPFPDNVDHAAAAGITAIVQPGGSVKDAEVIAACDGHGIAMLVTGRREFRH